jgi:hypothetical protein
MDCDFESMVLNIQKLVLLAARRTFEGHEDRSIGSITSHAPGAEAGPAQMEVPKPLHEAGGLCVSVPPFQGDANLSI